MMMHFYFGFRFLQVYIHTGNSINFLECFLNRRSAAAARHPGDLISMFHDINIRRP